MRIIALACIVTFGLWGCSKQERLPDDSPNYTLPNKNLIELKGGLLASRYSSLDDLKKDVHIEYFNPSDTSSPGTSKVQLKHSCNGKQVMSILKAGISQDDITAARDGGYAGQIALLFKTPYGIANRKKLEKIYSMARWWPKLFGEGDVAFYNLAKASVEHIIYTDLAFTNTKDTLDKGYINTFNHITAQALITACFNEELADYLADLHELHNMKELTHGHFTQDQLTDPNTNPVDNYIDMINNEWGQELGKALKQKYGLSEHTQWTKPLLTDVLNDIQAFYSHSFGIGFEPFRSSDLLVVRFTHKLNCILNDEEIDMSYLY
ncbi:MAG: hypothetical protein JJ975_08505 [Bacteroidia bacterium]|nr:hypothetical protein [Bacteroidia bacterium]